MEIFEHRYCGPFQITFQNKPDPGIGIMVHYHGELRSQENNIVPESILAIDGRDALNLSSEEILDIIDNAKKIKLREARLFWYLEFFSSPFPRFL